VAVALSAPGLPGAVAAALRASGLPPDRLTVEVPERTLADDPGLVAGLLPGVAVTATDWGTAFGAAPRDVPVTRLKVSAELVARLPGDPEALAMTAAVVDLARVVRLPVVAPGVETAEQAALLRRLGCAAGQGPLWPAEDSLAALADRLRVGRGGFAVVAGAVAVPPDGDEEPVGAEHGLARLVQLHQSGASLATIAAALNSEGFRTPSGARWHRSAVARVVRDVAYPSLTRDVGPGPT
jgi:hypothetical protein